MIRILFNTLRALLALFIITTFLNISHTVLAFHEWRALLEVSEDLVETEGDVSEAVVQVNIYKEIPLHQVVYNLEGNSLFIEENEEVVYKQISSGSAFFISEDGYLITNKHVVADQEAFYTIVVSDEEKEVDILYRDPLYDIAVLRVEGGEYQALALADEESVEGDSVIAVGNAFGVYSDSTSFGKVEALDQDIYIEDASEHLSGLIMTSAKVYPGDSGGPLLNSHGEVIGVNVATAVGEEIGFAIPASLLPPILEEVI